MLNLRLLFQDVFPSSIQKIKHFLFKTQTFFVVVYIALSFSMLLMEFHLRYSRNKNLNIQQEKVLQSYEAQTQKYEIETLLKKPVSLLSQINWTLNALTQNNDAVGLPLEALFASIARSMVLCPEIPMISLSLGNGQSLQILSQPPSASSSKGDQIYQCVALNRTTNQITEMTLNSIFKKVHEHIIQFNHNTIKNYFLASTYEQISLLPWFDQLRKTQKPLWIPAAENLGINEGFYLSLISPLRDQEGHFIGIAAAHVPCNVLNQALKKLAESQKSTNLSIIGKNGDMIASSDHSIVFQSTRDNTLMPRPIESIKKYDLSNIYATYMREGLPENLLYTNTHQEREVVFFLPIMTFLNTDWTMISTGPSSDDNEDKFWLHLLQDSRMLLVLYGINAIFIILLLRHVTKPMTYLTQQLSDIKNLVLDYPSRVLSSFKELYNMEAACAQLNRVMQLIVHFVPRSIANYFITEKKSITVSGQRAITSHLFCDMAGFSHMSEWMPPENVVSYLSVYFDAATKIIAHNKGIVDQYIGDAISAFWGAPYPDDKHALLMGMSALQCAAKLNTEVNAFLRQQGLPDIYVSFGLSSGHTVVGALGSSYRMQYTAIGQEVWRAERLQELNRYYGTQILADENVYQAIAPRCAMRPVDHVFFKGEIILVYQLVADMQVPHDEHVMRIGVLCASTGRAWAAYQQKQWQEALEIYQSVLQEFPGDPVAAYMQNRCQAFVKNPPEKKWDGVYDITSSHPTRVRPL